MNKSMLYKSLYLVGNDMPRQQVSAHVSSNSHDMLTRVVCKWGQPFAKKDKVKGLKVLL
jgi:hypothetical protein